MRRALHNSDDDAAHISRSLAETDPLVREALDNETRRQRTQVELIASENIMSRAVREALGHEIGNKTLEGYPGNRFHGVPRRGPSPGVQGLRAARGRERANARRHARRPGVRARGRGDRHPHGSTRSRFGRHPRTPSRDRARPRRDHVEQEPRPLQPGEPFEVDRTAPRRLGRNDTRLGTRRHGSARRVHRRSPPRRGPLRARPRACEGRSQDRKACTWR